MIVFCELGTLFPDSIFNSQDYNGLFQKKCSDISRKIVELGQNENSLNFFFLVALSIIMSCLLSQKNSPIGSSYSYRELHLSIENVSKALTSSRYFYTFI